MTIQQLIDNIKKGHTASWDAATLAEASALMRNELLDALGGLLTENGGDTLTPARRKALEVYGSWDYHNERSGRPVFAEPEGDDSNGDN